MKKSIFAFAAMFLFQVTASAQITSEAMKERAALSKTAKEVLQKRSSKQARKEAKQYAKKGWEVAPGALPIEKQLEKSYTMQYEVDAATLEPAYVFGNSMVQGQNLAAAKMQATELARVDLVANLESEIALLVSNKVGNQDTAPDEATSLAQMVANSKTIVQKKLGRVTPVIEMYRTLDNGNKEVQVRLSYSMKSAKEVVRAAIQDELKKLTEEQQKKVDELLGQ